MFDPIDCVLKEVFDGFRLVFVTLVLTLLGVLLVGGIVYACHCFW